MGDELGSEMESYPQNGILCSWKNEDAAQSTDQVSSLDINCYKKPDINKVFIVVSWCKNGEKKKCMKMLMLLFSIMKRPF